MHIVICCIYLFKMLLWVSQKTICFANIVKMLFSATGIFPKNLTHGRFNYDYEIKYTQTLWSINLPQGWVFLCKVILNILFVFAITRWLSSSEINIYKLLGRITYMVILWTVFLTPICKHVSHTEIVRKRLFFLFSYINIVLGRDSTYDDVFLGSLTFTKGVNAGWNLFKCKQSVV